MPSYVEITGSIMAMALTTDQTLFALYHSNSYAANPVMLRSPKPMVMRDVFLTKCKSFIPNPLSCLYVANMTDCLTNCAMAWAVAKPITEVLGWRHVLALYVGAGFFSSFAYVFATQMDKSKTNSEYDCTATSNGAYAAYATLSLMMPRCYIPYLRRVPIMWLGAPYLLKCTYDEYIAPKFVERRRPGDIELRNWGFVGGVFFTLIYSSLFLRTRADFTLARTFFKNLPKAPKPAAP
jgi:membrane associated rhomboid family serine protease